MSRLSSISFRAGLHRFLTRTAWSALGGVRWSRYPTADRRQGEREDRGEKRTAGYHR